MRRWTIAAALALTATFLNPAGARAGLVPVQVSVIPDGGMYRFTYAIVLPTNSILRAGDYFTIYDFDGFVPDSAMASGSIHSSDWVFSTTNTGPTPGGLLPTDNPNIPNLTWSYNGETIGIDSSVGLGNFWALSSYPDTIDSWFTASTGTVTGIADNNITPTTVPVPHAPGSPPGVPEPATALLALLGLPLLGVRRLWRKSQ